MVSRALTLVTLFLTATVAQAQTDVVLPAELLALRETDQAGRIRLNAALQEHGPNSPEVFELWEEQHRVDSENLGRLRQKISDHGWPSVSLVGYDGATAAFLILQHADHESQVELLPLIEAAAEAGEADRRHVAMLQDRVLVAQGEPQRYGTQLYHDEDTGKLALYPIEDEANVDPRRLRIGMTPLADYVNAVMGVRGEDE